MPFEQVKPSQLPVLRAISFVTGPSRSYSIRDGVFILFRYLWWTYAFDSPDFNFTCIIFFSWGRITVVTIFSASFWDKNSQLSIPLVISKFYIVSPPPSLFLPQYKQRWSWRYGTLVSFQTLMSALRILTAVTRGKPLVQTPQGHSSALVSLGSLEMGITAEVKFLKA